MGSAVRFNGRYYDRKRSAASDPLLVPVMFNVTDISSELLGGLQMLGFYVMMDTTGMDTTLYKLKGMMTNTRFFCTADERRAAYEAGSLMEDYCQLENNSWAMVNYNPEMGVRELEEQFAPQSLDVGGKHAMFYDIRLKGERILYELSMQQTAAQYIPIHEGSKAMADLSAISIIESDTGFSLSRHRAGGGSSDYGFQNFGGVKASLLTLRFIAIVGNYAYIFDYAFYVDGSLGCHRIGLRILTIVLLLLDLGGTRGPASSRPPRAPARPRRTFKADFGIPGVYNSLRVSELKAAPTAGPVQCPPQHDEVALLAAQLDLLQVASRRSAAPHHRALGQHLAESQPFQQNRIMASRGSSTARALTDRTSSSGSTSACTISHAPRTSPITLYSGAVSSVLFAPQNFFDQAQEGDLRNRRCVVPDAEGDELVVEDFGIDLAACKVALRQTVVPAMSEMRSTVVVPL
ncbi:hypothetical protein DL765_006702 [Monosporascus sp. GIB2]|nr:hypothetical protein DL765_006702 [Monosporascus sp. GIB2]